MIMFHLLFFFTFLSNSDQTLANSPQWISSDREILISFFKQTSLFQPWTNTSGWLDAYSDHCSWFGIQCDDQRNVVALNLPQNNLNGNFPNILGDFKFLETLDLSVNRLSGNITEQFSKIGTLKLLYLGNNQIQNLPWNFHELEQLVVLDLAGNQIIKLPERFGELPSLQDLDLSSNLGLESLPQSLLTRNTTTTNTTTSNRTGGTLKRVHLGGCSHLQLNSEFWNSTLSSLDTLVLDQVKLPKDSQGTPFISSEIKNFVNLTSLSLKSLGLKCLPSELGFLTNLRVLDLGYNELTGIPESVGSNLVNLERLTLLDNRLVWLPELLNFSHLQSFDLESNFDLQIVNLSLMDSLHDFSYSGRQFVETLKTFENNSQMTKLQFLKLAGPQITELPEQLGLLTGLTNLYLSENSITEWPSSLSNLQSLLQFLYTFQKNQTTFPDFICQIWNLTEIGIQAPVVGTLPTSIGNLKKLQKLWLLNTDLEGSIPTEIGMLSSLQDINFQGNTKLSGALPSELGELRELQGIVFDHNSNLEANLPSSLAETFNAAPVCNLILGNGDFSCESQGLFENRICNVQCEGNTLEGTWMNEDSKCKLLGGILTWNQTKLEISSTPITREVFEMDESGEQSGSFEFLTVAHYSVNCGQLGMSLTYLGRVEVVDVVSVENSSSSNRGGGRGQSQSEKYLMVLRFVISKRYITFFTSTVLAAVSAVCLDAGLSDAPINSPIDVTDASCDSSQFASIVPLTTLPREVCPQYEYQMYVDFESNSLYPVSPFAVPLMNNVSFCQPVHPTVMGGVGVDVQGLVALKKGWSCGSNYDLTTCEPKCGDGLVVGEEGCDSGSSVSEVGCLSTCQPGKGWSCSEPSGSQPSECSPICGDGFVVSENDCDNQDQNNNSNPTGRWVIGFVVGLVCLLVVLVFGLRFYRKRMMKVHFHIVEKELELVEVLGEGNFGKVFKASWRGTTQVAVKVLKQNNLSTQEIKDFTREAELLMLLPPHPNIVQFLGLCFSQGKNVRELEQRSTKKNESSSSLFSVEQEQSMSLQIVTEFLAGGNLVDYMQQSLSGTSSNIILRSTCVDLAKGIAAGMDHLHNNKIVHRDLAARNVLVQVLTGENVAVGTVIPKISDFGLASTSGKKTKVATRWSAPEVLKDSRQSSFKSDVWSFGIVLFEISHCCMRIPFDFLTTNAKVREYVISGLIVEFPEECGMQYVAVGKACLSYPAALRPTFSQIYEQLAQTEMEPLNDAQKVNEVTADHENNIEGLSTPQFDAVYEV